MSPAVLLAATAVIAIASTLQVATGMGMALVAAPLLALLDSRFVPVPTLIAVMLLSASVAWQNRRDIDRTILPAAVSGLLIGCCAGAALLAVLSGAHLDRVFALLILGAVVVSLSGIRVPLSRSALWVGGAASGLLGTMSGAHGPPIALVLQHEPPQRLRATLCAFFTVGCAMSLAMLGFSRLFGWVEIRAGLELLPGVAIGLLIGSALSRTINRRRARYAVLIMSALSAIALLFR